MRLSEAIRLRILELCYQNNITLNKLSTICGITQSTLNNIVSGRNATTTVSTVKKISKIYRELSPMKKSERTATCCGYCAAAISE